MIYLIENALSNQIDYYTWYNAFWSMDWKKSIRTWITSSLLIGVKNHVSFGWSLGSIFHHLISSILWLYYIYMLLNNITEHHGLKSQRVALFKNTKWTPGVWWKELQSKHFPTIVTCAWLSSDYSDVCVFLCTNMRLDSGVLTCSCLPLIWSKQRSRLIKTA